MEQIELREVKLLYNGKPFNNSEGIDVTPGKVYRALESEHVGCYYIFDDVSIEEWGNDENIIPHMNSWFIDHEESMRFTEVE